MSGTVAFISYAPGPGESNEDSLFLGVLVNAHLGPLSEDFFS